MNAPAAPARTPDEWANALTHGVGLVLSVLGLAVMAWAAMGAGPVAVFACVVFGGALVLLYGASTWYHGSRHPVWKGRLRLLDHLAILYLIAGSYTPFVLVAMRNRWGYLMLALVWLLAVGGTLYKTFSPARYHNGGTVLYLAMGWLSVAFAGPLVAALPAPALAWLAAGGACYTGGVAFFLWEKWRWAHPVWHLFVLAGSACHYVAVWHVLP